MSVQDDFDTPGYREWDAVQLRNVFIACGLCAEGYGLWIDREDEIWVMVTYEGLFAGWNNSQAQLPAPNIRRFGDVKHVARGEEQRLLDVIEELRRLRRASMIQCRYCGEMFTPGFISDRCCISCLSDVLGIIP